MNGGLNKPFVVCMPRTNVAESADVIKKVLIKIMAITVATMLCCKLSNVANKASSVFSPWFIASQIPPPSNKSMLISVPPNIVKHNAQKRVGTANTPNTNSLIVRPLDTLAINVPTNGDKAIHHAQYNTVH